jgi:hypothetical protein
LAAPRATCAHAQRRRSLQASCSARRMDMLVRSDPSSHRKHYSIVIFAPRDLHSITIITPSLFSPSQSSHRRNSHSIARSPSKSPSRLPHQAKSRLRHRARARKQRRTLGFRDTADDQDRRESARADSARCCWRAGDVLLSREGARVSVWGLRRKSRNRGEGRVLEVDVYRLRTLPYL